MTVDEILAGLGIAVDPAKTDAIRTWNGKLASLESDAQAKLAEAEQKMRDSEGLQRVVDENIRISGLTEAALAEARANAAAWQRAASERDAAIKTIKDAGFSGLNIPELPAVNLSAPTKDPVKQLEETIMNGIGVMGQTMNEMNRYQRVFGAAVPEDPATIADRAIKARLSVRDYMEQTYKVSAKEQEKVAAAQQKERDDYAAKKIEEYKLAHPVTTGHSELGGGVPSNYPNIPKPSDAAGVAAMAGKSPMEKIKMARDRVSNEVKTRMNAA